MFKNDLTIKMPCWGCKKIDDCQILECLLNALDSGYGGILRSKITGLTFTCSQIKKVEL